MQPDTWDENRNVCVFSVGNTRDMNQGLFTSNRIEPGIVSACCSRYQLCIFIYVPFNDQVTILRNLYGLA
jgi:hypothetical protein